MSNEAIRIRPFHRAPIRRAAVTGLFALWLAPLPADPQACGAECRCGQACQTEAPGRVAAEPAKEDRGA